MVSARQEDKEGKRLGKASLRRCSKTERNEEVVLRLPGRRVLQAEGTGAKVLRQELT